MRTDGLIGALYIITEWLMRFSVANLLWLLFNLPIFIVSLNLLVVHTRSEYFFYLGVIMLLLPIFFFPATTALFALARKWAFNEPDQSIIRSYWKYFKENYLRSLLGGIVMVLIWAIFLLDYFYFINFVHSFIKYLFYALFLFLTMFTIHFFSNLVHFNTKLSLSLKNALYLTIKNPVLSLFMVLIHSSIIFISLKIAPFLFLFFTSSLIAYLSFIVFYKVSLKTQSA